MAEAPPAANKRAKHAADKGRSAKPPWRHAPEGVRLVAAVLGIAAIVTYLVMAVLRLDYPYALEPLEGNSLIEVHRILTGQQLYTAPSASYVVDGYPPLYFFVSAAFASVLGTAYLPLRVVSLLSSLVAFAVLGHLVKRETGSAQAGLGAAGVFAATYFVTGDWFDVGRVDSLFLALSIAGLYAARYMKTRRGAIAAGLLFAAVALTKQTGLLEDAAVLGVLLIWAKPRRKLAVMATVTWAVVTIGANLVIWRTEGRWYLFFVYELLHDQALTNSNLSWFWTALISALGLAALAAAIGARRVPLELLAGCGAMAIEGYTALVKTGGSINDVLPAYLAVALLAGLALGSKDRLITLLSGMLVVAQTFFLLVGVHPAAVIPTGADSTAGARLAAGMRALGGDAVAPGEPELSLQVGTALSAHPQAALDVVNANDPKGKAAFDSSTEQAIADHQYSAIIDNGGGQPLFGPPDLTKDYQKCTQPGPIGPNTVLYPQPGGKHTVPAVVWIPKGGRTCQSVLSILNSGKETGS